MHESIVDYIVGKDLTDIVLLGHSFGTVIAKLPKRLAIALDGLSSSIVLNDGESLRDNIPPTLKRYTG